MKVISYTKSFKEMDSGSGNYNANQMITGLKLIKLFISEVKATSIRFNE